MKKRNIILIVMVILVIFSCNIPEHTRSPRLGKDNPLAKHAIFTYWVSALAFSPDGRFVAIASSNEDHEHVLRLWDTRTFINDVTINLTSETETIQFHPGGISVVCLSMGNIQFWNTQTGKLLRQFKLNGFADSMCFSRTGHVIARGDSNGVLRLWDSSNGEEITVVANSESDIGPIENETFSLNGRLLAYSRKNEMYLYSLDNLKFKYIAMLSGHTHKINSICFSPDSKRVVSASRDGTARVWDTETGSELMILTHTNEISKSKYSIGNVLYSLDGSVILSGRYEAIYLWDSISGMRITKQLLPGRFLGGYSSPDGFVIASESNDKMSVLLWDIFLPNPVLVPREKHNH